MTTSDLHPTGSVCRRALLAAGLGAAGLLPRGAWAQDAPVSVPDLLGRTVFLPRPARRVVLGSGRYLAVLNLIHPDPAALVAGWNDDFRRAQAGEYAAYRRRFPALDAVPVLSHGNDALPAESVLGLRPDLVLLPRVAAGAASPLLRSLDDAGVPVAVVDFFQHPLADTEPSLRILGRLLGREDAAERLLQFYRGRLQRLQAVLPTEADRPSVFMHAHAGGLDCCYSPGRGTFDDLITLAGGRNIGAGRLPGVNGQLGLEYVLTSNPDFYVATGGPYGGRGGVSLGESVGEDLARDSLADELRRQGLDALSSVRNGRAYAIWHGFNDSPAHLLAAEAMARWLHPRDAAGIDPAATLRDLNTFAAVPMNGTYWIDLHPS